MSENDISDENEFFWEIVDGEKKTIERVQVLASDTYSDLDNVSKLCYTFIIWDVSENVSKIFEQKKSLNIKSITKSERCVPKFHFFIYGFTLIFFSTNIFRMFFENLEPKKE